MNATTSEGQPQMIVWVRDGLVSILDDLCLQHNNVPHMLPSRSDDFETRNTSCLNCGSGFGGFLPSYSCRQSVHGVCTIQGSILIDPVYLVSSPWRSSSSSSGCATADLDSLICFSGESCSSFLVPPNFFNTCMSTSLLSFDLV